MDPLATSYAYYSSYAFAGNKPIKFIDLDGLEIYDPDANRPTGINFLSESTLPPDFEIDRNSGIQAGNYTLHGVKSEVGEWWIASKQGNRGYEDRFIVGTESFGEFFQNPGKYEFLSETRDVGFALGGNADGDIFQGYKDVVTNPVSWIAGAAIWGSTLPRSISTPYGAAIQSKTRAATSAIEQIKNGAPLYRVGTLGRSQTAEAQFWSLENPANYLNNLDDFAQKFGIPAENLKTGNIFVEQGKLKANSKFITREAPGFGTNSGGAIEVVTPPNSVKLESFNTVKLE